MRLEVAGAWWKSFRVPGRKGGMQDQRAGKAFTAWEEEMQNLGAAY